MTRRELITISFMFGVALTAIPFLWLQEEKDMFKFNGAQQLEYCRKVTAK